jgi:hypothetical protein
VPDSILPSVLFPFFVRPLRTLHFREAKREPRYIVWFTY